MKSNAPNPDVRREEEEEEKRNLQGMRANTQVAIDEESMRLRRPSEAL